MKTLVTTIIGIWLLNAALEIPIGLFQIFIGLVAGCLGIVMWALSFFFEGLETLWQTAFSKS